MDPQKMPQLDPKLKDIYQRIMGTTFTAPAQPAVASPMEKPANGTSAAFIAVNNNPTIIKPQQSPAIPSQPSSTPAPQPANLSTAMPASPAPNLNFTQMNAEVPAPTQAVAPNANFSTPILSNQNIKQKKKTVYTPIVFAFLGIVFILIYTVFWAVLFKLKLPFSIPKLF